MSEKVDQAALMRYIELEKEIQGLEAQNALKTYEVRLAAAKDVKETIENVEVTLQALILSTKKEKKDVDDMQKQSPNDIKSMFKDEASFNARLSKEQREKADVDRILNGSIKDALSQKDQKKLTKEQEEYLEAKNKEEVARQQLQDLKKQNKELEDKANEVKAAADKQTALYEDRDNLLSDIFGGEYGSEMENMLEAQYDSLMDRKQRVSVANYKWTTGRVLLGEAVKQMSYATKKWIELKPVNQMHIKYQMATEVRNNLVAAMQNNNNTQSYLSNIKFPYCDKEEMKTLERAINNIYADVNLKYHMTTETRNNNVAAIANVKSTAQYLGEKIKFPYLLPKEIETLQQATNNIYSDMADPNRHDHALKCYDTTCKREGALTQWFDNVINETISKDLEKVAKEAREVEKKLRAERIRLIREKISESGGDVSAISDAGLKGMTDQTKLSDADMDLKGIGITRPARVGEDHGIPDAQQQDDMIPTPTPIPMSALSAKPTEEDLFGDISELKEEYKRNTQEYIKTQDLNKARMEQGLQQKLAQRRHKKK